MVTKKRIEEMRVNIASDIPDDARKDVFNLSVKIGHVFDDQPMEICASAMMLQLEYLLHYKFTVMAEDKKEEFRDSLRVMFNDLVDVIGDLELDEEEAA